MKTKKTEQASSAFCRAYLDTMDPEQAAAKSGEENGYRMLRLGPTRRTLDKMRASAREQIRGEDVIRQLARLAFGRANDAVKLVLHAEGEETEDLDLTAVSEIKVTEKGVEVKLVDRIRALESLWDRLQEAKSDQAEALYRALMAMGDEADGEDEEE